MGFPPQEYWSGLHFLSLLLSNSCVLSNSWWKAFQRGFVHVSFIHLFILWFVFSASTSKRGCLLCWSEMQLAWCLPPPPPRPPGHRAQLTVWGPHWSGLGKHAPGCSLSMSCQGAKAQEGRAYAEKYQVWIGLIRTGAVRCHMYGTHTSRSARDNWRADWSWKRGWSLPAWPWMWSVKMALRQWSSIISSSFLVLLSFWCVNVLIWYHLIP